MKDKNLIIAMLFNVFEKHRAQKHGFFQLIKRLVKEIKKHRNILMKTTGHKKSKFTLLK